MVPTSSFDEATESAFLIEEGGEIGAISLLGRTVGALFAPATRSEAIDDLKRSW